MSFHDDKAELARLLNPAAGTPAETEKTERRWAEFQAMFERVEADPDARAELADKVMEVRREVAHYPDLVPPQFLTTVGAYDETDSVPPLDWEPDSEAIADSGSNSDTAQEVTVEGPASLHFEMVHGNVTISQVGQGGGPAGNEHEAESHSRRTGSASHERGRRRPSWFATTTTAWVGASLLVMIIGAVVLSIFATMPGASFVAGVFAAVPATATMVYVLVTALTSLRTSRFDRELALRRLDSTQPYEELEPSRSDAAITHTTGSGKSYSMALTRREQEVMNAWIKRRHS